jgi:hypothetical protein
MFLQSTKMQIKSILHQKGVFVALCILFLFVFLNFFSNVYKYNGKDIIDMYFPMKLLLLSDISGALSFYFFQYFPLLVILPAGFSYLNDRDSREIYYIQSRVGIKAYYKGKISAVFLVNFFVFTIPFLLEMLLNCIAFPIQATGDLSNIDVYEEVYIKVVERYFFHNIYVVNPYLYTFLFILFFGILSGILIVFINAISMFPRIKYKILLFLPIYLLFNGFGLLKMLNPSINVSTNYFDYMGIFDDCPKSGKGFIIVIILLIVIPMGITLIKSRKDSL